MLVLLLFSVVCESVKTDEKSSRPGVLRLHSPAEGQ